MNIKKIVKNSAVLSKLFYTARRYAYSLILQGYRRHPVQNDLILFNNFNGKGYGDNPKAIAEAFHRLYPRMKLVWAVSKDSESQTLPPYIRPVKFQTKEYFEIMAVSKVWVFNVLLPSGVNKRKEQIYVQTWHGDRPIKKILKDAADDSPKYRKTTDSTDAERKNCDYFISGSGWFSEVWRRCAEYEGEILEYGMPRNDCLVNEKTEENRLRVKRFKEKHHIPYESKILLYAPTFRDHSLNDEGIVIHPDLEGIIAYLKEKDHCEWVCVIRAHSAARFAANISSCIDVSDDPDMSDVLLCADFLITDYSSCAGDFALRYKPVILYQEDVEDYTKKDRQLYFEMNKTPYLTVHNMYELYNLLDSLNEDTVYQNCEDILSLYQVKESGNSAETVCRIIAAKMTESLHESGRD